VQRGAGDATNPKLTLLTLLALGSPIARAPALAPALTLSLTLTLGAAPRAAAGCEVL
jgi:hypothetical protein